MSTCTGAAPYLSAVTSALRRTHYFADHVEAVICHVLGQIDNVASRTGRYEAHIWQEGKQIYLGGFDAEEQAALAYDLAALKFRGTDAQTNYDKSTYEQEMLHFDEVPLPLITCTLTW